MPPRPRPLSDPDRAAWADYARQVRPLAGREPPAAPPTPRPPPQPAQAAVPSPRAAAPRPGAALLTTGTAPPGLDKSTWQRFRGGKLGPVRRLDLHGKTVQAAYLALERFLHTAHADQLRCVEVITGRGSGETGGAIRRELPLWLNLPGLRPLVLAATHPHEKNPGSTWVLLKRARQGRREVLF